MTELVVPELALVVLVGPTASGKTTFAARHFAAAEILAPDSGITGGDPEQRMRALDALRAETGRRLATGGVTVVDASNVSIAARAPFVALARDHHVVPVAIVFDVPLRTCLDRNAARPTAKVSEHYLRGQHAELRRGLGRSPADELRDEGFKVVHVVGADGDPAKLTVRRQPMGCDRRGDRGPFDIVGDVHGCGDELGELLQRLGWQPTPTGTWSHSEGRRLLFLGDLVDRGPRNLAVLELAMRMCAEGRALCVPGNHDAKLLNWLVGKPVRLAHGMQITIAEFEALPESERADLRARARRFLEGLEVHLVLDGGRLVVAHAGLAQSMHGRTSGAVRHFALYGDTNGEVDEYGLPVRLDWAAQYRGDAAVVYGHTPMVEARWVNGTICLDTGCVFGGKLTALRWPERELVDVPAHKVWFPSARPLGLPTR